MVARGASGAGVILDGHAVGDFAIAVAVDLEGRPAFGASLS